MKNKIYVIAYTLIGLGMYFIAIAIVLWALSKGSTC